MKLRAFFQLLQRWPSWVLSLFIVVYQKATDHRPTPCRFVPSCSYYALEAVEVHGAIKGSWMAVRRLVRCRPGSASGWDPVPDRAGNLAPDPTASKACL